MTIRRSQKRKNKTKKETWKQREESKVDDLKAKWTKKKKKITEKQMINFTQ